MPIEWDRPLQHKKGGPTRLGGLDVFFDFVWRDVFNHNRAIFPNGQSLAELVAGDCPDDKQATLLLTIREDVSASIRETDDRYIVVVPIQEYLRGAGADAASTYYARLSGAPLTRLPSLREADFTEPELRDFLGQHLNLERLRTWSESSDENRAILRQVLGPTSAATDLRSILEEIELLDPEDLDALIAVLRDVGGADGISRALEQLTDSTLGRHLTSEALGDRLDERIADVRARLKGYAEIVSTAGVSETEIHQFLESDPWIVGLAYVRVRARVEIPRGEVDFVLDRYDGFFDILEMKSPDDAIFVGSRPSGERPASASAYSLSRPLSQAVAQAHLYRSILERSGHLSEQYGLTDTRQPRVIILIGRSGDLSETTREILRQLNLSLHRVEVLPYDILGRRSEGWLENIEELLAAQATEGTTPPVAGIGDNESVLR